MSTRRWRFCVAAALALRATVAAAAEGDPPLSIEDAVRTALTGNPRLRTERAQVDLLRARKETAAVPFSPSLTGAFTYQPQTANPALSPSFKRAIAAGSTTTALAASSSQMYSFWSANVGLQWTLTDFGKTVFNYRAAARNVDAEELTLGALKAQVELDARLAYLVAVGTEAAVDVAQETIESQRRHLEQARAFLAIGTKTRIDVASAESELASAEVAHARAVGDRARARAQLSAVLGDEILRTYQLSSRLEEAETVASPNHSGPGDVGARLELQALAMRQRSSAETVNAARTAWAPELRLSLGPSWAGADIDALTTNFSIGLALAMPAGAWNPMGLHAQLRDARAGANLLRAQEREQRNAITLQIAQAEADVSAAQAAARAAQTLVAAARERRDLAEGRYRSGISAFIELSDAELAYSTARYQQVTARLDLAQARARLAWARGGR